ncbi:MAG: hypothetical protein ACK4FL_04125 [Microgenomates group bacterium]
MTHWSVDEEKFKKEDPEGYKLWRWVYLINERGLKPGEKIDKRQLKKVWPKIKDQIDPEYRRMLEFFLWGKLYSLPANLSFFGRFPNKRS